MEQPLHVFDAGDIYAFASDFAKRPIGIRIVAHQRRHIKRCRKPSLSFF